MQKVLLASTAFKEGEAIPQKYTCDGENLSPALSWSNLPQGTKSLALIMDDPDAPGGTWVHWVVYSLDGSLGGLPEGVVNYSDSGGVGVSGTNSFRKIGYGGPCPPSGSQHRYFFKLYALDFNPNLKAGASKAELEKAMQGHTLGQGQLMGVYKRKK